MATNQHYYAMKVCNGGSSMGHLLCMEESYHFLKEKALDQTFKLKSSDHLKNMYVYT